MGIRMSLIPHVKNILQRSSFPTNLATEAVIDVQRAAWQFILRGDKKRRFVVPASYLSEPAFQDLLNQTEEEFVFNHPEGGLTIPWIVHEFIDLTSRLSKYEWNKFML